MSWFATCWNLVVKSEVQEASPPVCCGCSWRWNRGYCGTIRTITAYNNNNRFWKGQIIPVCAEWFGEINKDFEKIVQRLAREEAASSDVEITISPLISTDRKGGTYPIMLQQFKREIGVAIVCGKAKHKLAQLYYVRAKSHGGAAAFTRRSRDGDSPETTLAIASELMI